MTNGARCRYCFTLRQAHGIGTASRHGARQICASGEWIKTALRVGRQTFTNLKELLNSENDEPVDAEPQIDRAAELQEKWQTASGQLWKLGEHRLLIGDCTVRENVERLMGGERAILMVTDPPYGVEYDPEWRDAVDKKGLLGNLPTQAKGKVENDNQDDWTETYKLFSGDVASVGMLTSMPNSADIRLNTCGFILVSQIIWRKPQGVFSHGDYHWQHEPCLYMVRKGKKHNWQGSRTETTIWDIAGMSPFGKSADTQDATTGHGTQKPVDCMSRPIRNNSAEGGLHLRTLCRFWHNHHSCPQPKPPLFCYGN